MVIIDSTDFLAVIPARKGSKGVPGKNTRPLCGKPLVTWTIQQALASEHLKHILVTSDDPEVLSIARKHKLMIHERPPELATDDSLIIDTLKVLVKKYPCKAVVLLQPTSPIRNPRLIDFCIEQHIYHPGQEVTVTGFDCYYKPYGADDSRRQDIKPFFYADGNVYIINSTLLQAGKMSSSNYYGVYHDESERYEIDTEFDFWLVQKILEERM